MIWGRLDVLVPKHGKPADSPSAYRPICLLDEVGKLFERVFVRQLEEAVSRDGPGVTDCQYGFRRGRSTLDAIDRVKSLNGHPGWGCGVCRPTYKPWCRITCGTGKSNSRPGMAPSGPFFWDLKYDSVLRGPLPTGARVVCYADDTLLVVVGREWTRTVRLTEMALALVVARIRTLRLRISPQKTEVIWFHGLPLWRRTPQGRIWVGDACIQRGRTLRPHRPPGCGYVDHAWSTFAQRRETEPEGTPPICGSGADHGPIWVPRLGPRPGGQPERAAHVAIRVVRSYRILSHEMTAVLAIVVPFDIQMEASADVYRRLQALRLAGDGPPDMSVESEMRRQSRRSTRECPALTAGWTVSTTGSPTG
ncbi:uncharacterized protein LOC143179669 [Calliopsis andreniformis]|uniref:uncharacterized protein LOC143179669 n=1 Tax=Calliopsis andreniformis TaxID=337506 RepID=UPI003FCD6F16